MSGCWEITSGKLPLTGTLTEKASQTAYYMQYPSLNLSSPTLQPDEILKPLSIKLQKRDIDVYETYNYNENLKGEQQDIREGIEKYVAWIGTARLPPQRGKQTSSHLFNALLVGNSTEAMSKQGHRTITTKQRSQFLYWIILFLRWTHTLTPIMLL